MAEGDLRMMLNSPAVRHGPCTDLETLANQVYSVFQAMGFPGPLEGPDDQEMQAVYVTPDNDLVASNGDPLEIAGAGTQNVFLYVTDGTNTAEADAVDSTLTLTNGGGIGIEVVPATKEVILTNLGSGTDLTEGDGIIISAGEISVDAGDYLEFASGTLQVALADTPGLESDGSDPAKLRSKSRFVLVRGQATTGYHGATSIVIDNIDNLVGELPNSVATAADILEVTVDDAYGVWLDDDDYVYAIAENQDGDEFRHLGSVGHRQALKGNKNFDDTVPQFLGHNFTGDSNGTVSWRTIEQWLRTVSGYDASANLVLMMRGGTLSWRTMEQLGQDFLGYGPGNPQSLGHSAFGAIQWQDDINCP